MAVIVSMACHEMGQPEYALDDLLVGAKGLTQHFDQTTEKSL
jgi:hypothetical protein